MGKIMALKARGNEGKTTTIKILYNKYLKENYRVIHYRGPEDIKDPGDILAVVKIDETVVGITSAGDTYDDVFSHLNTLINEYSCTVCVSASKTRGGTHDAFYKYETDYEIEFIEKTICNYLQHIKANKKDAKILFDKIIKACK
ncbi:hypothetical protein P0082_09390 [Candidatus Haliotispira prima]|uniref:Uncharacterized protein n=1 Tax=Candidatus Haliotispira prima TaxID=3034016 RepID=A0ABY8MFD7_9SPIO|nr:hypothetical protein P0082_09390 [Candidatus Haliotispira prima]